MKFCFTGPATFSHADIGGNTMDPITVPRHVLTKVFKKHGHEVFINASLCDILLYSDKTTVKYKTAQAAKKVIKSYVAFFDEQVGEFKADLFDAVMDTWAGFLDQYNDPIVDVPKAKHPPKEKLPSWYGIPYGDAL